MKKKITSNIKYPRSLLFIVGFAIVGSLSILFVRADTAQVPIEAESSSTTAGVIVSDSSASGGQYFEFNEYDPETWYGYEKPGPNNTGPRNPDNSVMSDSEKQSELTHMTNAEVISAMNGGQRLFEDIYIHGAVTLPVGAHNITIRNFVLDAGGSTYGINNRVTQGNAVLGLVLEDGEIFDFSSAALLANYTARRLNVHESKGDAFKMLSDDITIESSWWHHLGTGTGAHADGLQGASGSSIKNIVIRGNNCDMPINSKGGPGEPYKSNRCWQAMGSETMLFEYNWLNGGNYTMSCGSNTTLRNNRFGRGYNFGIITGTCGVNTGNVWDDTGEPI